MEAVEQLLNLTLNLTNSTPTDKVPSRLATAITASIAFVFIVIGIIGNFIVLAAILRDKTLRTNTVNCFVVSLCINDVLNICLTQAFVGLTYANQGWIGGLGLCKAVVFLSIVFTGCALWHHCLIAIHRYIVVVHPQVHRKMSQNLFLLSSILISRIIPVLSCMPIFLQPGIIEYSPGALRCLLSSHSMLGALQHQIVLIGLITLPCVVVLACFIGIFVHVHRHSMRMTNRDSMEREMRITKMFGVIFLVFFCGYMPYGLVRMADKGNKFHVDVYIIMTSLYCIAISVNPILYGLMNTQIREVTLSIFPCCYSSAISKNKANNAQLLAKRNSQPLCKVTSATTTTTTEEEKETRLLTPANETKAEDVRL